ncbi:hypothetical protein [Liquorilactobacillus hordei]|uniref:Uncharacterized protein n=1 Tax=Liquorilactobacillus hordei DSM 19519 TaxID=1423759 RepID=A0A0R1MU30_9LACO|nr:hypothetical protein [Liquorilactobacillus hordei]KRL07923.1 hypothetical protein FC92_GL000990 [Liquorilactobacillus hordei DSM 19519]QYH51130.1 hypothetical protein G6O70_00805 [Liquorilactobacillus hordei DSM 19519]
MATKFDVIYKAFLNSVDSYEFNAIDDEELEETLWGYLDSGRVLFVTYSKDLYDVDLENKQFNVNLNGFEISMLAKAMKLEWISRTKNSEEMMKKSIGDRDYQAVQGYNYIAQLSKVERQLRTEIQEGLVDYEYSQAALYGEMG